MGRELFLRYKARMSNDSAKQLLAQADRLMKKGRTAHDDLPVLTDFVATPPASTPAAHATDDLPAMSYGMPLPEVAEISAEEFRRLQQPQVRTPVPPALSLPPGAIVLTRAQFDERVAQKLEELQHAVFNQVMQQIELHAAGDLKAHLRSALLPPLTQIAEEIASQVAEETSSQIRNLVGEAVAAEVARLREQLSKRRG